MSRLSLAELARENRSIGEELFKTSLVSNIATSFSGSIGPMVDGVMIGNFIGGNAVAAYTVVAPIMLVYNLIGGVIAGGSRTLFSHLLGAGDAKKANGIFSLACVLSFGISAVCAVLSMIFAGALARLLGATGSVAELFDMTRDYLLGFCVGIPFYNTSRVISGYMQIDGDAKRPVYAAAWMTVVDIVGDVLVVFVFHGGMFGMGLATALGNIATTVVFLFHFRGKDCILHFSLKDLPWKETRAIITEGAPTGVSRLANFAKGRTVNMILSGAAASATAAIAAYGVQKQMNNLFFALYIGIAEVVWMLSSIYYGEEDSKSLKELQTLTLKYGLALTVVAGGIIVAAAPFFANMYARKSSPEVLAYAVESVRLFGITLPLLVLTFCFSNYLMGTGRIRLANIYSFLQECGVVVPVIFVMYRFYGVRGAWLSYPITQFIMLLVALVIILRAEGAGFREKMLLLSKNFGTKAGEELEFMVESKDEAIFMAATSRYFAQEHGMDEQRGYILELAVEEMAVNVIQHGFPCDDKHHSINLRILTKGDELIIRMRDDCPLFDPKKQYETMKESQEDPTKNMGIRLIMQLAKDFQYISTLKTNNLIIKV